MFVHMALAVVAVVVRVCLGGCRGSAVFVRVVPVGMAVVVVMMVASGGGGGGDGDGDGGALYNT